MHAMRSPPGSGRGVGRVLRRDSVHVVRGREAAQHGKGKWKKRWTCCGVYGEDAASCRRGWHASYSDGATRY